MGISGIPVPNLIWMKSMEGVSKKDGYKYYIMFD